MFFPESAFSGVIIFSLILACYYYWSKRHLFNATKNMDGPVAIPFFGSALHFLCKDEEILGVIYNVVNKYKSPFRFWLGSLLCVCSSKSNHVEKILSSPKFANKHDLYDFVKNYLGEGLVSGSGPVYKCHKRIIQPLINLKFSMNQIKIIQKHSSICMLKLDKFVDKEMFDIQHIIHKCFVDIIGEAFLGKDMNCQENGYNSFHRSAIDMYKVGFTRLTRPWLHPNFIYKFTKNKKQEDIIVKNIRYFISDIITESWQRRKLNNTNITDETSPIIDQIGAYIDQNPDSINSTDFVSHLITLYAAAEDTMTIISSFVILCLGMYPEYQEKAAKEIRKVFGDTPRNVKYDDIVNLEYLDMCIKDVERLCPIAPYILRKSVEEFQLDETYCLPKDCCVVVPIFNLHRDSKHWENPDNFHPDHFLPENVKNRHSYAFIPFSAGPRGCIGKIFANICLKVFLSNFLQIYEVEANGKLPNVKLMMDISTRPIDGYNVRLKRRIWK